MTVAVRGLARPLLIPSLTVLCLTQPLPALAGQDAAPAPSPSFEEVAARAARARESGAADEAIRWYRSGVRMRPQWDEGWWYLATGLYEGDRYAEAATAFARFLALKPQPGPARALRGLCLFQVKDYPEASRDLARWMADGSIGNAETQQVAWYHLAILRIREGQFELALEPMTQLCRSGAESPRLVRAAGLMLLRFATLPTEVPREKEELVDLAGRAGYSWIALRVDDAQARFRALLERFPEAPNAHYCYGLFLLSQGSDDAALAQFGEEMKVQPLSVYPRLETAFELLKRGDYADARPYAEEAVRLAPGLFAAHNALGRILVELDQVPRGIGELEEAARLAPESPEMYFALAHAYGRAGRTAEAEKARTTFQKLDAARRAGKVGRP
ncbi:MAG TPA: tetratricopeptide repeat protein [Vicinamibacteria bacterium]|nr:tetratricopeptide repeat protein [Vicinamibacteria bacterium]